MEEMVELFNPIRFGFKYNESYNCYVLKKSDHTWYIYKYLEDPTSEGIRIAKANNSNLAFPVRYYGNTKWPSHDVALVILKEIGALDV